MDRPTRPADVVPLPPPATERGLAYLTVIWRHRAGIVLQTLGAAVIATIVVLLLPSWYRARTVVLPPQDAEAGLSLSAMLSGVRVPGVSLPGGGTALQIQLAILRSRWVAERVVRDFHLQRTYKAKTMDDAIATLRLHSSIATTDEGTIAISVEDKNPATSARMANAFVHYLDTFNREMRTTRGSATRRFVERRLAETADTLAIAERDLVAYQRSHRSASLGPEMASGLDAAAKLLGERMNLAIRLDALRQGLSETAPEVTETRAALGAMDRQLGTMPETGIDLARLYRRLKVNEQLYTLLTAQVEEARITEARDTPTVDVLDAATAPARRSRPKRKLVIATTAGVALVVSTLLAFGRSAIAATRTR